MEICFRVKTSKKWEVAQSGTGKEEVVEGSRGGLFMKGNLLEHFFIFAVKLEAKNKKV